MNEIRSTKRGKNHEMLQDDENDAAITHHLRLTRKDDEEGEGRCDDEF